MTMLWALLRMFRKGRSGGNWCSGWAKETWLEGRIGYFVLNCISSNLIWHELAEAAASFY